MSRLVLVWLVLGGLIAAGRASVVRAVPPGPLSVEVVVPAGVDGVQARELVDEEILLAHARALGWDRTDAVIHDHLVRSLRFVHGPDRASERELRAEAFALGLDRTDPLVRRRLLDRARRVLVAVPDPPESTLEDWRDAHPERFLRPDRLRFARVFLSRDRRGADLEADAAELLEELATVAPEVAYRLGDPLLTGRSVETASLPRLAAQWGDVFVDAVGRAPLGAWTGPIETVHGLHLVHVLSRTPGVVPPLSDNRGEVLQDWREATGEGASRGRMDRLRARTLVSVVRP